MIANYDDYRPHCLVSTLALCGLSSSMSPFSEYEVYRETIRRLLGCVGLWPGESPSLTCRFFICVQLIVLASIILAIVCFLVANITDVAAVTVASSALTGLLSTFLKFIWMLMNRDNVSKLHQLLDPHFIKLLNCPSKPTNLLKGVFFFRRMTWLFAMFMCVSIAIYASSPLVFMVQQYRNHIKPVQYMYMHPAIYPWQVSTDGFGYKLLFICELTPHFSLACVTIGVNSLFTLHVFQIIGQMRELSHRVLHMDEEQDYRIAIRQCVDQFEVLIECRDLLDEVYGPMILWVIITNGLILCGLMFQISQMKSLPFGRIVLFAIYFLVILTETWMFAWSGTALTEESEYYTEALYSSNWHANKDFKTFVLIMLMQKTIILTACKFSHVSIDILTKVLNTALSYYFLLRTIND